MRGQVFKQLILSILMFFFITNSYGQTESKINISGKVLDSALSQPVTNASVILYQLPDKKLVQVKQTDKTGKFSVILLTNKHYQLEIGNLSFDKKLLDLFYTVKNDTTTSLGEILLVPKVKELKTVNITSSRPIIKQEIDRIAYNVQIDPDRKTESTLDMLRKVPLITVDGQDHIELKGSRKYQILVNGRPSSLFASDPSTALKGMPANSIQRIEVITVPPAKYDAEGLAGLINIVTVKKTIDGYNGSIGASENFQYGPLTSISLNLKSGKLGLAGFCSYHYQNQPETSFESSIQTFNSPKTNLTQIGTGKYNGGNYNINWEISYEIDSLNLLTFSVSNNKYDFRQNSDQQSVLLNGQNQVIQSYRALNNGKPVWSGLDIGFNYQIGFKKNKDQNITLSYKFAKSTNNILDNILFEDNFNYDITNYNQNNNSGLNEHTAQLDYIQPSKDFTMEAGIKGIWRNSFSDFNNQLINNSGSLTSSEVVVSDFNYGQDIYSLYNDYKFVFNKLAFKGGLRLENTVDKEELTQSAFVHKNIYLNLIPSASFQYSLGQSNLNLGFTQRIQRPNIYELSPFENKSNPKIITTGNPNLTPVLSNNFEVSYSNFSKGSIFLILGYAFINNNIERVTRLLPDTVTKTTYENIGRNRNLSFSISSSQMLGKDLRVNFNGQINYIKIQGDYIGQQYANSGFQSRLGVFSSYKINDNMRTGLSVNYTSPTISLQGRNNTYVSASLNVSRQLFNKHLTVFGSINNPFSKYVYFKNNTSTPDFSQMSSSQYFYRTFVLSLNYSFGQLKQSIKKAKQFIKNDDIKPAEIKTGN